jgi:aryl-alcohol dehydrogenase-like predicted oxidoreductase
MTMTIDQAGTYSFAGRSVTRLGYGAMQLAGPGVFGPPRDHDAALAVLRAAVEAGVNHIDTSDFYGPHVTNRLIREALSPYSDDLLIVTKIGARRGDDASWLPAFEADELARAVEDNLANLGLEALDVVNLRLMFDVHGPAEGSLAAPLEAVADLQRQGLVRHIGLSNVTPTQFEEARDIAEIVCVQNQYNLAHRDDDAFIDALAAEGVAYVPFFPLGGFSPLQSAALSDVAARLGATPMQVALAWLLQRSPNILLIPGTSSVAHLHQNLAAASLTLPGDAVAELDALGRSSGRPVGEHHVEQARKAPVEFVPAQRVDHLAPGLRRLDQPGRAQQLQVVGQRALRDRVARRGVGAAQPLGRGEPRHHGQPIGIGQRMQRQIERNVLQPGMGEAGHATNIGHHLKFNSSVLLNC